MKEPVTKPRIEFVGPVLDSPNPLELARFYEQLLGWAIVRREGPQAGNPPEDGWALLRSPEGTRKVEIQWEPNYVAPTWPSVAGGQLMMMHLDFGVDDLDAAVAWAVEAGARVAGHQPQDDVRVLLDPDGHPFCLFSMAGD